MTTHVSKTVSSCFAALRQIRSVKHSVTRPVLLSLVLTRLDYGNATLAGLSGRQTSVCSARRCSTDLLQTKVRAHNAIAQGTALVVCTLSAFSSKLRCSFSVVSMVLLRHTLLTSCSLCRPWSHAEGCDPWPRLDWTSRGRDGPP